MKRALPMLALLLCLCASARAQSFTFDQATAHKHGRTTTKTFLWVGRAIADSNVLFRFNFLGNVMRLQDSSGRQVRLYYDFDGRDFLKNIMLIATLEGSRVDITYDPTCGMVLSIAPTPESRALPLRRGTPPDDTPSLSPKFPRRKT